jgi:hypothetical protein
MLPEEQAIAKLRAAPYAIDDEKIDALEEFFRQLRRIDERVMAASPTVLYESQWALLGFVSRSYQLMLCCIEQIAGGKANGFYAAARGLAETLGSIAWASESPERLTALVRTDTLRNKALLDAARRKYPGFGDTYSVLSRMVHPNRGAHLLTPWPVRQPPRTVTPFSLGFSDDFAQKKIAILVEFGPSITSELTSLLAQSPDISKRGKVMLEVVFSSDATPKHL